MLKLAYNTLTVTIVQYNQVLGVMRRKNCKTFCSKKSIEYHCYANVRSNLNVFVHCVLGLCLMADKKCNAFGLKKNVFILRSLHLEF